LNINEDRALPTKLLDIRDNNAIIKEVKFTTSLINPRFDFQYLDKAFCDVGKLFRGHYPGFQKCNTNYHDFRHTMLVLLALARLLHGAYLQGIKFTDKEINLGLISALMHDTGYIQTADDDSGTGAQYTLVHIKRSIMFVQDYYAQEEYFREDLEKFADILNCTGLSIDIKKITFSSANIEIIGKSLGTADLLGQMADRLYLEKLIPLFYEFEEGKVSGFDSELDLLKKTTNFYYITKTRLEKDLGNVIQYMADHFKERWNIDRNIYNDAIEKNINYLKFILKTNEKNVSASLRRNAITLQ
jgi:hypothetical protein